VTISCAVERAGRALTTMSARVHQHSTLVALALAAFSEPWPQAVALDDAPPPAIPAPEEIPPPSWERPAFAHNFDYRFAVGERPFSGSARALTGGWLRLTDPEIADAVVMAAFADAWPPAVFTLAQDVFRAPTIDLSVHFRTSLPVPDARPGDFHLATYESRLVREGFFEEDGAIWTRDGQLIAQSRQLALALPAPGGR
jgi:acyl-CoA thioesterase